MSQLWTLAFSPAALWNGTDPRTVALPAMPSPWNADVPGWYYIEQGGTNTGWGHPADPRGTRPATVSAGERIVIGGTLSLSLTSPNDWNIDGDVADPVFIMPFDENVSITGAWEFRGGTTPYVIVDGLNFDFTAGGKYLGGGIDVWGFCLRNSNITGPGTVSGTSSDAAFNETCIGFQPGTAYGVNGNFVFYNCNITKAGNWQYTGGVDPDAHGLGMPVQFTEWVYIQNCEISYCSGNGWQFVAGTSLTDAENGRFFFCTNNYVHHIAQAGGWFKRSSKFVCAGNTATLMRRDTPSSPDSAGFGGQYGPRDGWFLNNVIHDCQCGIQIANSSLNETTATSGVLTFAGNLIYDIHNEDGTPDDWRTAPFNSGGVCVSIWDGATDARIVNNTIDDSDVGIISPSLAIPFDIHGNIFSGRNTGVLGGDILLTTDPGDANQFNYNLFEDPYVDDAGTVWTSVASFTKGTGNVEGTPVYANQVDRLYELMAGSPGIADGASSIIYAEFLAEFGVSAAFDLNGLSRPYNGDWNIGAFEGDGSAVANITTLTATNAVNTPTFCTTAMLAALVTKTPDNASDTWRLMCSMAWWRRSNMAWVIRQLKWWR